MSACPTPTALLGAVSCADRIWPEAGRLLWLGCQIQPVPCSGLVMDVRLAFRQWNNTRTTQDRALRRANLKQHLDIAATGPTWPTCSTRDSHGAHDVNCLPSLALTVTTLPTLWLGPRQPGRPVFDSHVQREQFITLTKIIEEPFLPHAQLTKPAPKPWYTHTHTTRRSVLWCLKVSCRSSAVL